MHNYLLFFDAETSGFPKDWNSPVENYDNWPFIVQIAWLVYHRSGKLIKSSEHFIKPKKYRISEKSTAIHGITQSEATELGDDRREVLEELHHDLRQYRPLFVSHCVEYDEKVVRAGFHRVGLDDPLDGLPKFCTMKAAVSYCDLPGHQYPTLNYLYRKLFLTNLEEEHNAKTDVRATMESFFAMRERGIIVENALEEYEMSDRAKYLIHQREKGGCSLFFLAFFLIIFGFCMLFQ